MNEATVLLKQLIFDFHSSLLIVRSTSTPEL